MSRNSMGLSEWFFPIFGFALVGGWLWKLSPWAFGVFAAMALYLLVRMLVKRRQDRIRGYSFDYKSPGIVRGEENEMAIEYREGDNWILFYGLERGKNEKSLVYVPSAEAWDGKVEPWAKGRRAEIVGRLAEDEIMRNHVIVEGEES